MVSIRSLEHLPTEVFNPSVQIGTRAMGAIFKWAVQEWELTRHERTQVDTSPKIVERFTDRDDPVHIFRIGFRQDVVKFAEKIDDLFEPLGSRVYMKGSPDEETNKDARLSIVKKAAGRPLYLYGISKGGKDELHELTDSKYRIKHGKISRLTFESTPFDRKHIRFKGRAALIGAYLLPRTHSFAEKYAYMQQSEIMDMVEDNKDPSSIRSTDILSFYEHIAELPHLRRRMPSHTEIKQAMSPETVDVIKYFTSPYDATVKTQKAFRDFVAASGRDDAEYVVCAERGWGNHAGITDHPLRIVHRHEKELRV